MDGDETLDGTPQIERQERPVAKDVHGRPLVPQRVPELAPTPLQGAFIYLSIVVLVCGVFAYLALELGTPMSSPVVKIPVLIGGVLLLAVTADALVRVGRSVGAWRAVDTGRAYFRVVWAIVLVGILIITAAAMLIVLTA